MKTITFISLFGLCIIFSSCSESNKVKSTGFDYPKVSTEVYHPDSIKTEFVSLLKQIQSVHPNMGSIVDIDEYYRVKHEVLEQITKPMTQLEVYRLYSVLNPVLADGHCVVFLPQYKDQIKEAVEQGDRLFPLHVFVDKDFSLWVKTASHGLAAGTEVQSINGVDAVEITRYLEQRIFGDNRDFRRVLVGDRFAENLWIHYGSSPSFELVVKEGEEMKTVTIEGATDFLPHRRDEQAFEDLYSFEFLADKQVGYLNTKTWWFPNGMDRWLAFTDSIFTELRDNRSKYLIIDVRENGGGDDQMWMQGIMPYIAKKKWKRMLHFLGRVREIDQAYPGRLGELAIFDYYGEFEVSDKPKFDGGVYIIVGRKTYSSSIMLSSAIKDNELGTIVGQEEATFARGCQTGMPLPHKMNTTGMRAVTPQHWYQRNTEGSCMTGVPVDIQLPDNPFNEREIVDAFVEQLTGN